jgi:2-deoxy-D-gluconate 3-dehydrogenase
MDIRNISEIEGLKAFIKAKTAKVDILINNAGYVVTKPAWDVSEQDWDTMVDTGFKGVFFCCQAIGSLMREQGYGKIINLSSTYSQSVFPGRAVYAGIKAGINHLTEALALEWAPHGIRVNAIAPTAVNTPSRQTTLQGTILEQVLARIPLGRLATSDDLLGAVMYFGSEASDFVTGQTLFIDGGWVAAS